MKLLVFLLIVIVVDTDSLSLDTKARIVGKTYDAKSDQVPWHVRIDKDNKNVCNGGLISLEWVLTAASCFTFPTFVVNLRLGDPEQDKTTWQLRNSREIKVHPDFNVNTNENDIALVRVGQYLGPDPSKLVLQGQMFQFNQVMIGVNDPRSSYLPLEQTTYIRPISYIKNDESFKDANMNVTSYGSTSRVSDEYPTNLKIAYFEVISNEDCEIDNGEIRDTQLCANGAGRTKSVGCKGDKGAPGTILNDEKDTIIGIYSFSQNNCTTPSVFTRVSKYIEWIKETSGVGPGMKW